MINGLKPYPAMTVTGVPWLDRIPAHWKLQRGKWLFKKMDRPVRDADEVVTCFRDGTVTLRKNRRLRGFTESLKEIGYQGIRRGDLVIHAMDAFAGAIGVSDCDGKGTPVYSVCQPGPTSNSFYFALLLREMARNQWIQALAKGIRERSTDFRFEDFGSLVMPLPSLPEQGAIVRFLDYWDRRIRRYIHAKRKLIKLLEEQKQTIVDRAVTRGLDPNVRLAPSRVEWLGDLPNHWEVVRLKSLVSRVTSGSRGWSNFASDSGVLFIRIANLTRSSIDIDLDNVVRLLLPKRVLGEAARTRVRPNDILISITAYIGSVAVVPFGFEEAYVSQHVACCRPRLSAANPRWIGYVLLSNVGQTHGRLTMYGGTKHGLSLDDVKNYIIPLPPSSEQNQIVVWIEQNSLGIDSALRSTKCEILRLMEYRARLIGDVVTGKLDVRDVAARLPYEPEDSDVIDEVSTEFSPNAELADVLDEELEPIEA